LRQPQPLVRVRAEKAAVVKEASKDDEDANMTLQGLLFFSYFAAQSGMSFYMKWLLSKVRVAQDLTGIPASFLVTSSQQMVSFVLFLLFVLGSQLVGKPYRPKALKSRNEIMLILGLSLAFSLNIGLNLTAVALVPLSLTMIIRGCSPLSTAFLQATIMNKKQDISAGEWACMIVGVFMATACVIAQSGGPGGSANFAFFFGVAMSVFSLFSAALDFVFKGMLGGTEVKLNAMDTVFYQAIPVAVLTTIMAGFISKPVSVSWAARYSPIMTDFSIFARLWEVNPAAFGWVGLSGACAFIYNIFVTFMVVKLSPATTAFAGNFNKAATILMSLLILEGTGISGWRGMVTYGTVLGNICAFTCYNVIKGRRTQRAK